MRFLKYIKSDFKNGCEREHYKIINEMNTELDQNYYRPTKEQLEKIAPKIEAREIDVNDKVEELYENFDEQANKILFLESEICFLKARYDAVTTKWVDGSQMGRPA